MARAWRPNLKQERFLASSAFEILFGGQAGGGKTDGLLVDGIRYVEFPQYNAIIFRRSYDELRRTVIARSLELFGGWASYNKAEHVWTFPSGARLEFAYLDQDTDVHRYQGAAFQFVGWEELTTQPREYPYRYMFSRVRGGDGIPLRVRSTANPGGPGHDWVLRRFAPWLYQKGHYEDEYRGPYAGDGTVLHFVRTPTGDELVRAGDFIECSTCGASWPALSRPPAQRKGCRDHPVARSRQFIRARLEDNPHLFTDGQYAASLQELDPVSYEQLRYGDWMIRPAAGLFFKREWFRIEPHAPARTELGGYVRYWDRAGSVDGDFTVGVLMARHKVTKAVWVLDVVRARHEPHDVLELVRATAEADRKAWGSVRQVLEQDPGQAGKFEVDHYERELLGFEVEAVRPTGDKVTRAKPWSAHCKNGAPNADKSPSAKAVRLVSAVWNRAFIDEHAAFPDGPYDDQVDGASGAFNDLAGMSGGGSTTRGKRGLARAPGGY